MQRRASSRFGARIAWVGQISMQRVQVPQCAVAGGSIGSGRSTKISPRKNQLPPSLSIRQVSLPIQPSPALRASARYSTGAESTNTRWPNGPISPATVSASACRRLRISLW